MASKGITVVCLLLGVALAGCADNAKPAAAPGQIFVPQHDEASGSIAGSVVDDAYLPLTDAKVYLLAPNGTVAYMLARTDASGRYALNFIPTGTYLIEARAQGYQTKTLQVEVVEGEVVQAALLVLVPGVSFQSVAFYVVDHLSRMIGGGTEKYGFECGVTPWQPVTGSTGSGTVDKYCVGGNACGTGRGETASTERPLWGCSDMASGCLGSYSTEVGVEDNGYGGDNYRGGYRDLLRNNTNWKSQVAELMWTQSSAVSGRGVLFEVLGPNVTNGGAGGHTSRCGGINQSDPRDFLVLSDQPPVRLEINQDLIEARKIAPEDQCCDWRLRLFPGWCDLGNCERWGPDANQLGRFFPTRVEIYYTIFIGAPAPPGWTVLEDQ